MHSFSAPSSSVARRQSHHSSVGRKLFLSVTALFLVFAVAFIVFQQVRERQYRVGLLDTRLEDFNHRMASLISPGRPVDEAQLDSVIAASGYKDLRVTVITLQGRVVFDNTRKDYAHLPNHASRPEVRDALAKGHGTSVGRFSNTLQHDFFYSATRFPQGFIVRSALPYNNDLSRTLQRDQHFIWFALIVFLLLTVVLYRFADRLGTNIAKLNIFASRADRGESLDVEDLAEFPDDELGEIAERIIKIYKRLQTTRQEQDVLKRELTQNIAHELKTPVASIQGYLETLLNNPAADGMRDQFLRRCYAQSERLTSLLRDISTLNRLDDAPRDELKREAVDVAKLVGNIRQETALQLKERGMTFDDRLPERLVLRGDSSLLYSVFRNLTDNAIAYAGHGTTITLSAERKDDSVEFTFSDNGVGVAPEHLPRLFERFYRVDKGRSRKLGGTGLGLAIVKNAVLRHGGHISVANNPSGGLRFTFTLPI